MVTDEGVLRSLFHDEMIVGQFTYLHRLLNLEKDATEAVKDAFSNNADARKIAMLLLDRTPVDEWNVSTFTDPIYSARYMIALGVSMPEVIAFIMLIKSSGKLEAISSRDPSKPCLEYMYFVIDSSQLPSTDSAYFVELLVRELTAYYEAPVTDERIQRTLLDLYVTRVLSIELETGVPVTSHAIFARYIEPVRSPNFEKLLVTLRSKTHCSHTMFVWFGKLLTTPGFERENALNFLGERHGFAVVKEMCDSARLGEFLQNPIAAYVIFQIIYREDAIDLLREHFWVLQSVESHAPSVPHIPGCVQIFMDFIQTRRSSQPFPIDCAKFLASKFRARMTGTHAIKSLVDHIGQDMYMNCWFEPDCPPGMAHVCMV